MASASALQTLPRNPNSILSGNGASPFGRPCFPLPRPSAASISLRRLDLAVRASPLKSPFTPRLLFSPHRHLRLVPLAADKDGEPKQSDVEAEKEKRSDVVEVEKEASPLEAQADESQEAWKKTMESVKEEGLKLKGMSEEAYEVYSKKAIVILQETSEKMKVQAEKTRKELSLLAKDISEEGKEYLNAAAKNSPDEVKDIVETFASVDELKDISAVRDFYVGIPYGAFLALRGFLSFMLTGSVSAIRFGVILGSVLLALSIKSLRSWKRKEPSELLLKGQAVIAAILFIREWRLFSQWHSFPTFVMTLISGAVLAFYVYRIMKDGSSKGSSKEQGS